MIILTRDVIKRLLLIQLVGGALVGLFVIQPLNEFVLYWRLEPEGQSALSFVWSGLKASILGPEWLKGGSYAAIGAALGGAIGVLSRRILMQQRRVAQRTMELERELVALLAKGESQRVEFKSSFRWDVRENKLNKGLEQPVLKTLAAFLNSEGGTLLIGVADDGQVFGLANDYKTLKKKDRDGFEQAIMSAVSSRMGTDACANLQLVFHEVEGRDICRIMVRPSARPVYLRQGNEPEFYVRTGTSTRELNVEEAIEYIKGRF